jgi:DNA-binding transcriptional ArsR family regulator
MKYMNKYNNNLKPQDVLILLKIVSLNNDTWFHHTIAQDLGISQSEVSQSLNRSKYSGLIDSQRKNVNRMALKEFLFHGIAYAFPQQPTAIVRGVLTAHAADPLRKKILSNEKYVWPYAKGTDRGQAVEPLYNSVPQVALKDQKLYELLTLVDAIRIGRAREKELARHELEKRI